MSAKAINFTNQLIVNIDGQSYTINQHKDQVMNLIKLYNMDTENSDLKRALMRYLTPQVIKEQLTLAFEERKKQKVVKLKKEAAQKIVGVYSNFFDYDTDGEVYLTGFNLPMPKLLVDKMCEAINKGEDINSFINFWKLCMLNPNPQARKDLFKYIEKNNLVITHNGYLVTYRRVVSTGTKNEYNDFVISSYNKLKGWKKAPKNYYVTADNEGNYKLSNIPDVEGDINLQEVYNYIIELGLEEQSIFTDNHTKTFKIRIGEVVKMKREDGSEDASVSCDRGLHGGTPDFVRNGSFGDTIIGILVNPSHVLAVPYQDCHKMRFCEYYPFAVLTMEEVDNISNSDILTFDSEYYTLEQEEMERLLQEVKFDEKMESQIIGAEYTLGSDKVNKELTYQEMKDIISSRIKTI